MSHRYQGGVEPPFEELLVDPIVRLVLRRDRINAGPDRYIDEARHRLLDEDRQTRPLGAAAGCLGELVEAVWADPAPDHRTYADDSGLSYPANCGRPWVIS